MWKLGQGIKVKEKTRHDLRSTAHLTAKETEVRTKADLAFEVSL